ncbi:hypothetical protein K0M31_012959 [Melipona bicolor]|uniref:Uncharacterized protein n=1 Tax=Melipona bicolor TaxID=60889 RepID=A0AA40FJ15_9HYME|nr:hypothetical protein K0M31_012959 [Melipona bicolor]
MVVPWSTFCGKSLLFNVDRDKFSEQTKLRLIRVIIVSRKILGHRRNKFKGQQSPSGEPEPPRVGLNRIKSGFPPGLNHGNGPPEHGPPFDDPEGPFDYGRPRFFLVGISTTITTNQRENQKWKQMSLRGMMKKN